MPAVGRRVGFAQDPDADRLAIVDENGPLHRRGADPGAGGRAAAGPGEGTGRAQPLDLARHRGPGAPARLPGLSHARWARSTSSNAMLAEDAVLGGEGNGGVIDPRVGYVRDSFVAMALVLDLLAATGEPLSRLVASLPRYAMVKDQYPLAMSPTDGSAADIDPRCRHAALGPDRRRVPRRTADRRDGLRLDWDDRWVHIRASNTEPIVRVIAEAAERQPARELADRIGRWVCAVRRTPAMSQTDGPRLNAPPAVAFVDVDGTLLAQTTTFLFARILYRRGLIRRSFFLRALYHGLQHRFGRLDYGRLIGIGLKYIARIPVVELERIAYENFVEFVRPRLYEGVVEHLYGLRRRGTAIVLVSSSPGLVIEPLQHLSGLHRHADDPGGDRARPAGRGSARALPVMAKASDTGPRSGHVHTASTWKTRSPTPTTGAIGPCWKRSAGPWSCTRGAVCCGWPGPGLGYRAAPTAVRGPQKPPSELILSARVGTRSDAYHDC